MSNSPEHGLATHLRVADQVITASIGQLVRHADSLTPRPGLSFDQRLSHAGNHLSELVDRGLMADQDKLPSVIRGEVFGGVEDGIPVAVRFIGRATDTYLNWCQEQVATPRLSATSAVLRSSQPVLQTIASMPRDQAVAIERQFGLRPESPTYGGESFRVDATDAIRQVVLPPDVMRSITPGRGCPFRGLMPRFYGSLVDASTQIPWLLPQALAERQV